MRNLTHLLATVSVVALCAFTSAPPALAQTGLVGPDGVTADPATRVRAETALLYANTLDRLTQIIERDVAADPGVSVITGLRAGRLEVLPSLDPELRGLITTLRISARVIDADPDPVETDERAIVFVAEGDLKSGVTRADIEAAARAARLGTVVRLQGRQIQGADGSLEIPAGMSGLPGAAVAAYVGVRGRDLVTSSGAGSEGFRTRACPDGQFGTGIVELRNVDRVTTLGGSVTETSGAWTELSRSCAPEYSETIRVFGACDTASGGTGTAVFEVTQRILRDPSDPFRTLIEIDEGSRVRVTDGACIDTDRLGASRNFLVEGGAHGRRELALRTATSPSDIGSGVNRVPRVVEGEPGAGGAVSGIPFPARSISDFEFVRTCAQEYGPVAMPAGSVNTSGTGTGAWTGPDTFFGDVSWHRDYNRRETTFTDDPLAYILNYDLVLTPHPDDTYPKDRKVVPSTFGPAPLGNGWYRSAQVCERELSRSETQTAVRDCAAGYPAFPLGTYQEQRNGTGAYRQNLGANPTLLAVNWGAWYETSNACFNRTVNRTDETRTIKTSTGSQTCDQPQRRTRVDTTTTFQRGGANTTTAYEQDWTNSGNVLNCVSNSSRDRDDRDDRSSYIDVDGDGRGDFSSVREAERAGFTGNNGISGNYDTVDNYGRSSGVQNQVDYSRDSKSGDSGGSGGSSDSCFASGTCILMADGTERPVEMVRIGDHVADGGRVYMTGQFLASDLYRLDGVEVTGDHLVRGSVGWVPVREHPAAVRLITGERLVHNIATTCNKIRAGGMLFADYAEISGPLIDDLLEAAGRNNNLSLTA